MTTEQARIRARQLNAQINLKRHEERRLKFEAEAKALELRCAGFLPDVYREQFEQRYFSSGRVRKVMANKDLSHWRCAQRIILELQLEPSDWFDEAHRFYDWFFTRKFSLSYASKIFRLLNLWGYFVSRKLGRPFLPIPRARGLEKSRLLDAYFSKVGAAANQSDPLLPDQLAGARSQLIPEQYNWPDITQHG